MGISIGVIVLGIAGLVFGMNIDKTVQEHSVKLVAVNINSPTKAQLVASDDEKSEGDKYLLVETTTTEDASESVDYASTNIVEADASIYLTSKDGKYKVKCSGNVDDKNLEVSLTNAVDLGCKYIEEQLGETTEVKTVQLSKSDLSGIRNGSATWNMSYTTEGRKKEFVIDAQTGAIILDTDYVTDDATDEAYSLVISEDTNTPSETIHRIDDNVEAFSDVDIRLSSADIEFVTGEEYSIQIVYGSKGQPITYQCEKGKLTVSNKKTKSKVYQSKQPSYVIITVPKKSIVDHVQLNLTSGNILLNSIVSKKVNIEHTSGDNDIKNITYDTCDIKSTSGDIYMRGDMYGVTHCTSISGDVVITCTSERANYSYDFKCTSGKIKNDNVLKKGSCIALEKGSSKDNVVKVNVISGNINLKFKNS